MDQEHLVHFDFLKNITWPSLSLKNSHKKFNFCLMKTRREEWFVPNKGKAFCQPMKTSTTAVVPLAFRSQRDRVRLAVTAWKMSKYGVFLVRIFPHSDWIRRDTVSYQTVRYSVSYQKLLHHYQQAKNHACIKLFLLHDPKDHALFLAMPTQ